MTHEQLASRLFKYLHGCLYCIAILMSHSQAVAADQAPSHQPSANHQSQAEAHLLCDDNTGQHQDCCCCCSWCLLLYQSSSQLQDDVSAQHQHGVTRDDAVMVEYVATHISINMRNNELSGHRNGMKGHRE